MSNIWIIDYSNDTITFTGENEDKKYVFECCGRKITINRNIFEMNESELEIIKDYFYDELCDDMLMIVPCN